MTFNYIACCLHGLPGGFCNAKAWAMDKGANAADCRTPRCDMRKRFCRPSLRRWQKGGVGWGAPLVGFGVFLTTDRFDSRFALAQRHSAYAVSALALLSRASAASSSGATWVAGMGVWHT
jgi:hypothetical protein